MPFFHALTLVHFGNAELGLGNPGGAWVPSTSELPTGRGTKVGCHFALNNLGEVARNRDNTMSRKYYEECEALLRDSGDRGDRARVVHRLGYIAQHEGDFARA